MVYSGWMATVCLFGCPCLPTDPRNTVLQTLLMFYPCFFAQRCKYYFTWKLSELYICTYVQTFSVSTISFLQTWRSGAVTGPVYGVGHYITNTMFLQNNCWTEQSFLLYRTKTNDSVYTADASQSTWSVPDHFLASQIILFHGRPDTPTVHLLYNCFHNMDLVP